MQTKEQGKISQDQINEEEIGNIPEKEFGVMIVRMIQDLGNRMEAQIEKIQEIINKDLKEIKNKQSMMNNQITEMKSTLEGINSRITEAEEWISELENRMVEITAEEQNKEKRMKRIEDSLRDLWDNIKSTNIHHLTLVRMAIIKNLQTINAGEGVEKREPSCTVGGNVH